MATIIAGVALLAVAGVAVYRSVKKNPKDGSCGGSCGGCSGCG